MSPPFVVLRHHLSNIYEKFSFQYYLRADNKLTTKEKSFTFAARMRMLELRENIKV